eukprot:15328458-Alexandrium_andersonii.AAC.1
MALARPQVPSQLRPSPELQIAHWALCGAFPQCRKLSRDLVRTRQMQLDLHDCERCIIAQMTTMRRRWWGDIAGTACETKVTGVVAINVVVAVAAIPGANGG